MKTMAARKVQEPAVNCPVCKAEVKVSSMYDDIGGRRMCGYCASYLAPERGGTDFGFFMMRITQREDEARERRAEYRPRGYWSDAIEVTEQRRPEWTEGETKFRWDVDVRWGSGGHDGSLSDIEAAEMFQNALAHAILIAKTWKMERQEGKEA